jgi:WD40 repeat protein
VLWEVASGRAPRTMPALDSAVRTVAWSPSGTKLAVRTAKSEVRLVDTATGTAGSGTLRGATALAWVPGGSLLALGASQQVRVVDLATGQQIRLDGHEHEIVALVWSSDGSRLASADTAGGVRVWTTLQPRVLGAVEGQNLLDPHWPLRPRLEARLKAPLPIDRFQLPIKPGEPDEPVGRRLSDERIDLSWSPDGRRIAIATGAAGAAIHEVTTSQLAAAFNGLTGAVYAIAWSPDGTTVATGGADRQVRLWDAADTAADTPAENSGTVAVSTMSWSPDGARLVTGGPAGRVRVLDAADGHSVLEYETQPRGISVLDWAPSGAGVVSVGVDGALISWDPGRNRALARYRNGKFSNAAWSPDGHHLAVLHAEDTLQIWDVRAAARPVTIGGDRAGGPIALAWSPDGMLLATGGPSGARLWEVSTGRKRSGIPTGVCALSWSAASAWLAMASPSGELRIWDPRGDGLRVGHDSLPGTVAIDWSPDGTAIAMAAEDGTIRVLDGAELQIRCQLRLGPLHCLRWGPAGIAVGGPGGATLLELHGPAPAAQSLQLGVSHGGRGPARP